MVPHRKIKTDINIDNKGSGRSRRATSRKRSRRKDPRFHVPCIQAKFIDENRFVSVGSSNKALKDGKLKNSGQEGKVSSASSPLDNQEILTTPYKFS